MKRIVTAAAGVMIAAVAYGIYVRRPASDTKSATSDVPKHENDVDPSDAFVMALEHRKYIWDIEQRVVAIDHRLFPPLAKALLEEDRATLVSAFAVDFRGQLPSNDAWTSFRSGTVESAAVSQNADSLRPADANDVVGALIQLRRQYCQLPPGQTGMEYRFFAPRPSGKRNEPPRVQFAIMRLEPMSRDRLDGPWKGTMKIRLTGGLADGGISETVLKARITIDAPHLENVRQRGWVRSFEVFAAQTTRAPEFLFADVTEPAGVRSTLFHDNWKTTDVPMPLTGGVFLCDFDNNDWPDVLITDTEALALLRGGPDGFRNVAADVGLPETPPAGRAACVADFDNDGWDDAIISNRVFRNVGGRFIEKSTEADLPIAGLSVSNYVVADYDRDGLLDVYLTDGTPQHGRKQSWLDDQSTSGNRLFRNLGGWKFVETTESMNASAGRRSSFTAAWLDADDDGWPDLAVADEFGKQVLLRNQGRDRPFVEVPLHSGYGGFAMGMVAGDLDNDGGIDLYTATMYSKAADRIISNVPQSAFDADVLERVRWFARGNDWFHNDGEFHFSRRAESAGIAAAGWSYGPTLADFNNDGWLDVYVPCGFQSIRPDAADG